MSVRSSSGSRGSAPVSSCARSQSESGGWVCEPRVERSTRRTKASEGSPCNSWSSNLRGGMPDRVNPR